MDTQTRRTEREPGRVEYVIIIALLAFAAIAALTLFGQAVSG